MRNIMTRLHAAIAERLIAGVGDRRQPDFIIGTADNPYLLRWWLTPWRQWADEAERNPTRWNRVKRIVARKLPNAYLHKCVRNDDDRALHDHPWWWCSILLRGAYIEHTIAAGGIHCREQREAPDIKFSFARRAHRVELLPIWWLEDDFETACDIARDLPEAKAPCWTLFVTGPVIREWGFHCPERGWRHWREFTDPDDQGQIGPGCGDGMVATPAPMGPARMIERELTPEADDERAEFYREYGADGNCSCHISPPCGSCLHPGNPRNQDEDDRCWVEVQADDETAVGP